MAVRKFVPGFLSAWVPLVVVCYRGSLAGGKRFSEQAREGRVNSIRRISARATHGSLCLCEQGFWTLRHIARSIMTLGFSPGFGISSTKSRRAEERLFCCRRASMLPTRSDKVKARFAAIVLEPFQNASSRLTLFLWPSRTDRAFDNRRFHEAPKFVVDHAKSMKNGAPIGRSDKYNAQRGKNNTGVLSKRTFNLPQPGVSTILARTPCGRAGLGGAP